MLGNSIPAPSSCSCSEENFKNKHNYGKRKKLKLTLKQETAQEQETLIESIFIKTEESSRPTTVHSRSRAHLAHLPIAL